MVGGISVHKRRHSRYTTVRYFIVRHLVTNEVIGFIGNLSPGGLMLYTREPFPSRNGEVHPLVMVIPESDGEAHVFLPARQVWSQERSPDGLYIAGFQIDELSDPGRRAILSAIARYSNEA